MGSPEGMPVDLSSENIDPCGHETSKSGYHTGHRGASFSSILGEDKESLFWITVGTPTGEKDLMLPCWQTVSLARCPSK